MAKWHPRLLAVVSWLFPLASGSVGIYAAAEAGGSPLYILIAAAALVVGSMFNVATSNSGNSLTLGLAVAAAIPFVFSSLSEDVIEPAASIAAFGVGLSLVWAFRHSRGEGHRDLLPVMVRRLGGYVTYAMVYSAMRVGLFVELDGVWEDLFPFAVAVTAWLAVEIVIRALFVVGPGSCPVAIWHGLSSMT